MAHPGLRDAAGVLCFAAFVAGLWIASPKRGDTSRLRRILASVFALGTLIVSLTIGVLERDLYPFVSWPLISWLYPTSGVGIRYLVVDAAGGEHEVDYRAWQPLSEDELATWMAGSFLKLDSAGRDEAARDLLRRANAAAQRAQARQRVGTYDRFLGPFSAPLFHLHPAPWRDSASVPPLPFRGLRVYAESWDPDERARDPRTVRRELRYSYNAAP
jgi:hypothetical protein